MGGGGVNPQSLDSPVVKPMTLMAMGEYREPRGVWFPSVFY